MRYPSAGQRDSVGAHRFSTDIDTDNCTVLSQESLNSRTQYNLNAECAASLRQSINICLPTAHRNMPARRPFHA